MSWVKVIASGVELEVQVVPRSSKSRVVGVHDHRLKIQLSAPPVDGEANAALIELLAELLGIRRQAVELIQGATSKKKRLRILGVGEAQVRALTGPPASK